MKDSAPQTPAVAQADGPPLKPLGQIMWDRSATRHFSSEPVSDEQLEEIFTLAAQAPSGFNLQPWRFVVVRDPARREQLYQAAHHQAKVREAPVVVVAFGRREAWDEHAEAIFAQAAAQGARRSEAIDQQRQEALKFISDRPISVWLNRHVMIAFTYLMLAAESLGLDTAPMEGFDADAVRAVVDLPADAEVIALLAIGRQLGEPPPHPGRLPIHRLFFADRFGQPWS